MKHLSSTQLSAHLDHALTGRAAEEAERHLAACEACRAALAALAAQDEALAPALTQAPGEAYFERFPAQVEDRIRAAGLAGAQSRGLGFDFGSLFSPRALAWVGGAAVVVVGAGLALMTTREVRPPDLRDREIAERVEPAAPGAPEQAEAPSPVETAPPSPVETAVPEVGPPPSPPASDEREVGAEPGARAGRSAPTAVGAPVADRGSVTGLAKERPAELPGPGTAVGRDRLAAAPQGAPPAQPAPGAARQASPGRAVQVRRNEAGEDVPVRRPGEPRFAQPPPPASAGAGDQAARIRKKLLAEPMKGATTWGATKSLSSGAGSSDSGAGAYSFTSPEVRTQARDAKTTHVIGGGVATEAEGRLCGEVLDAAGRPVAGAQVVVADIGRTATTDARGGFCIRAPTGEHPLSVLAVGYAESRQAVRVGGEEAAVRVTLAAVPVIEGGRGVMTERAPPPHAMAAPAQEVSDNYSGLSDTTRRVVRGAQRLGAEAAARHSATLFDASAGAWERALRRLTGGPLELETRWHLAEARYRAWESGPNARRASAAAEALTAYVVRAPASAERAQATRWLDRVKR